MVKLFGAAIVITSLAVMPARAADNAAGARCLQNCQAELKRAGKWESYPRGYCRRKCDYFVGAAPDVRR
jgi:hypothetical protein